ncbi:MAG: hotdog fold thioesterase [Desulfobacteraceae bacterium]|nr:hotdog fold thioesterase [Desulfobacteraceae bacterium]
MQIRTHQQIDQTLCGRPILLEHGKCHVEMELTREMVADATGLVHGGFIFGLADYAAMLAVNHPNVVLGSADVKFLKPACQDDTVIAQAQVKKTQGQKYWVEVSVIKSGQVIFKGSFTCFALDEHVLKR